MNVVRKEDSDALTFEVIAFLLLDFPNFWFYVQFFVGL